jgi:O-antigen ligase
MFKFVSLYFIVISWLKAGLLDGLWKFALLALLSVASIIAIRNIQWRTAHIPVALFSAILPALFFVSNMNPSFRSIDAEVLKELNFYKRLQSSQNLEGAHFISQRFRSIMSTAENSRSESLAIFFDSYERYRLMYHTEKDEDLTVLMDEIFKKIKLDIISFLPSQTIVDKNIIYNFLFWYSNILLIILLLLNKKKSKDIYLSVWFILINGALLALLGIIQKINYVPSDYKLEILGIWDAPEPRYFFSTFTYKNHWSAFAILSLFYASCIIYEEICNWGNNILRSNKFILVILFCSIIIASIIYSGSRSGLIILLVSVFLITFLFLRYYFQFKFVKIFAFIILPVSLIGLCCFIFLKSNNSTAKEMLNISKMQIDDISNGKLPLRWYLWIDALKVGGQKPCYGHGFNSYPSINPLFQSEYVRDARSVGLAAAHNPYIPLVAHAHNDWIEWWCEWGLLGMLVIFIPILIIAVAALVGNFNLNTKLLMAGVMMILLYSFFDFPTRTPACLSLLCLTFGTALAYNSHRT